MPDPPHAEFGLLRTTFSSDAVEMKLPYVAAWPKVASATSIAAETHTVPQGRCKLTIMLPSLAGSVPVLVIANSPSTSIISSLTETLVTPTVQLAVPLAKPPFLAIDQLVLVAIAPVTPALPSVILACARAAAAHPSWSSSSIAALATDMIACDRFA
ncbi:MAG: hypothetical protein ACLQLO_09035, partial [Mycobacterium sp.]